MAELTPCPSKDTLIALVAGTLPEIDANALATHLKKCPACQEKVADLRKTASSNPDGTALFPPPAPEATTEFRRDDADDLTFLDPPRKREHLGAIKQYSILGVVGRGGMGVVLKALDENMQRIVAIKVLAPQMASSATARKRFIREAKAAAAVTHDHVVIIHEVDEFKGIPYLVMEYVAGCTLQEKLDRTGPLEVKEILRMGRQIALGLAAAHEQGLIHRDIKPGNILLENGVERVKITDFGLARAADDASITQSGVIAGTPSFMAPEQALGGKLDHRADLFSLGSVLYVMCTGRLPFRAKTTMAVMKRVIDDTPKPVQEVNAEIPDYLSEIVAQLQEKKAKDRIQTAKEVADLLGLHLAEIQREARARKTGESAALPAKRSLAPLAAVTGLAALAVLVVVGILTYSFWPFGAPPAPPPVVMDGGKKDKAPPVVVDGGKKDKAPLDVPVDTGGWVKLFNGKDLTNWKPHPTLPGDWRVQNGVLIGRRGSGGQHSTYLTSERSNFRDFHLRAEVMLPSAKDEAGIFFRAGLEAREGYPRPANEVDIAIQPKHPTGTLFIEGTGHVPAPQFLSKAGEWFTLEILARGPHVVVKVNGKQSAESYQCIHIGGGHLHLQQHQRNSVVHFRKIEIKELPPLPPPIPFASERSPLDDLKRENIPPYELKVAGLGDPAKTPKDLVAILGDSHMRHWRMVSAVAFHPDGTKLASAGQDYLVAVSDVMTGDAIRYFPGHTRQVWSVSFDKTGKYLASAAEDDSVRIWDVNQGKLHAVLDCPGVLGAAYSPDGSRLIAWSKEPTRSIHLWNAAELKRIAKPWQPKDDTAFSAAFDPTGERIVLGMKSGAVKIFDLQGAEKLATAGHEPDKSVKAIAWSRDGKRIASGSTDATVRVWDAEKGTEIAQHTEHKRLIYSVAFSPDNETVASCAGVPDRIVLWSWKTGKSRALSVGNGVGVACSPDGSQLAVGLSSSSVGIWETQSLKAVQVPRGKIGINGLPAQASFSPDGRRFILGNTGSAPASWNVLTGADGLAFQGATTTYACSFSPDGIYAATGVSRQKTLNLWDAKTGAKVHEFKDLGDGDVRNVTFPGKGRWVTASSSSRDIPLYDVAQRSLDFSLQGHKFPTNYLAADPSGTLLASGAWSGAEKQGAGEAEIKVWDLASRKEVANIAGHKLGAIQHMEFSSDGKRLLACDYRQLIVLESRTGRVQFSRSDLLWNPRATFSADGRSIFVINTASPLQEIALDTGEVVREWPESARAGLARVVLAPDGRHLALVRGNMTVWILRLAAPVESPPFVILAKDKRAETRHPTLAAAVAAAQSGDTIEIQGNGPFVTQPIETTKPLCIRAGEGFRPHLKYQPVGLKPEDNSFMLSAQSHLVLEGLTLEWVDQSETKGYLTRSAMVRNSWKHAAPIRIVNCRLVGSRCGWHVGFTTTNHCEVRNSELLGDVHSSIGFNLPLSGFQFSVQNNVITARHHALKYSDHYSSDKNRTTAMYDVGHNSLAAGLALNHTHHGSLKDLKGDGPGSPILRFKVIGNVMQGKPYFFSPSDEGLTLEQASDLVPRLVALVDDQNLYAERRTFLLVNRDRAPTAVFRHSTLAEWHKFWGIAKSTSIMGTPIFKGGDVHKRSMDAPGSLTPADFRLAKGSPGQGVLPGGKDLGADVDLVGPGEPYERWKKTPAYQEWRKQTDALMAEALRTPLDKLSRDTVPAHELRALGGGDAAKAPAEIVAVLGDSRMRHWHNVHDLAYSPDGQSIASVGSDRALRIWDSKTGEQRFTRKLGNGGMAVAWSRNGKWIATGELENGRIRLWDARTGEGLIELEPRHKGHVRALLFSPDDKWLGSAGEDGTVCLWEAETGKYTATFGEHGKPVHCLAFSPDSKRIASGGDDDRVLIWTVADRKVVHTLDKHTKAVRGVAFRHDGKQIASGSEDATARVWDADTGAEVCVLEGHEKHVGGVAFQPGTERLAVRDFFRITLWDVESKKKEKELHIYYGYNPGTCKLVFRPDGKCIAANSLVGIRTWDLASGKILVGPDWPMQRLSVTLQPNGDCVCFNGFNYEKIEKNLRTGAMRLVPKYEGVGDWACLAFSPDARLLATGGQLGPVSILDATGLVIRHKLNGHTKNINCVAFSSDSKRLASASSDKTAILWDVATGDKLHTLTHKHQVHAVAFNLDGHQCVTGAGNWDWWETRAGGAGEVKVWDTQTGKETLTLEGGAPGVVRGVAWSRDGKRIAAACNDGMVRLWGAATGKAVRTFAGHKAGVRWVLFRHDSKTLLSVDADGLLLEWDGDTGNVLRRWQFPGTIAHLDLAADGRHLATANFNGTVYILRLEPDPALTAADTQPFVVLAKANRAETRHPTLAAAVAVAQSGDTIEIQGNGPFLTEPIDLTRKALTIKAGPGTRPVIIPKLSPEEDHVRLLATSAPLSLEGVSFIAPVNLKPVKGSRLTLVSSKGSTIRAAHCRFVGSGAMASLWAEQPSLVEIKHCAFLGTHWHPVGVACSAETRVHIDNSLIGALGLFVRSESPPKKVVVTLDRNTLAFFGAWPIDLRDIVPGDSQAIRLIAKENVLFSDRANVMMSAGGVKAPTAAEAETILKGTVRWEGEANLHQGTIVFTHRLKAIDGGKPWDAKRWQEFWGQTEKSDTIGRATFAGEITSRRLADDPSSLAPADFRLAKGRPGQGVLPGGKDLGADVDLVGPGEPYERWKKTPAYQEWKKQTDALMAKAAAETQPFVVLAKANRAETRHPTLAAAVGVAQSGDTIEIRGDGPFVMPSLELGKKALRIQAGTGFKSRLTQSLDDPRLKEHAFIATNAALVLEGLTIERLAVEKHEKNYPVLVYAWQAPLHVSHCRFVARGRCGGVGAGHSSGCTMMYSEFQGEIHGALGWDHPLRGEFAMENCLVASTWDGLSLLQHNGDPRDVRLRVRHNTIVSWIGLSYGIYGKPMDFIDKRPDPKVPEWRLEVTGNVIDTSAAPWLVQERKKNLPLADYQPLLPRFFTLTDERNLYSQSKPRFLTLESHEQPSQDGIGDLDGWNKLWGFKKSTSLEGVARFEGGDLRKKGKDAKLVSADFRLAKGSPGQGVLPGGKDLGADVDLIGPGEAYERWKKTPAYQEWRKQTEELMSAK